MARCKPVEDYLPPTGALEKRLAEVEAEREKLLVCLEVRRKLDACNGEVERQKAEQQKRRLKTAGGGRV